uniref:START domain-containing protein n=1 Tax=Syphacia muris TaxID=451379 RepID=A0A0N5AJ44_9BILA
MLHFDWDAVGKKPSVYRLYGSAKSFGKRRWTVAQLLQERELYGKGFHLSTLRCRISVDTMIHPTIQNLQGDVEPYMKHALLMGLSTDSSYVLSIVVSDLCSLDRFLVIVQLCPTALIPLYTIRVKQRRVIDYFFASFSRNSSIISVIASPKFPISFKPEPYFFDACIYLVNLKRCLLVELSATIRVSCRWNNCKLDRVCLRSTDYGAILNNGLSIVALVFMPPLLAAVNMLKTKLKVFRLRKLSNSGYEKSKQNLNSSIVVNNVRRLCSSLYPSDRDVQYSLQLLEARNEKLTPYEDEDTYFAISVTEVLPFIKNGIRKLVQNFPFKVDEIKCMDYELDIIECTPDFWVYSVVSTLIEVKIAKGQPSTYVAVFSMNTNVLTGNSEVCIWKKLRAVNIMNEKTTQFPYRRDRWYPFSEKYKKSVEERLVSDECVYIGESASILCPSFPGIELEKGASL